MEVSYIEFEELTASTCRCCLLFSEKPMDNIFDWIYEGIEFHEILNILAPISILADDGFSHLVCESCKLRAIEAFKFRQICIVSNDQIRSELKEDNKDCEEELIINDVVERNQPTFEDEISENDIIEDSQESFQSDSELSGQTLHNEAANVIFSCHICEEMFKSERVLLDHLKVHENSDQLEDRPTSNRYKSSRKHECQICGKRFETPSKLQRHMIVHRDVLHPSVIPKRPPKVYKYICDVCNKLVESPSKLQRHMRVHEKNSKNYNGINQHRPYSCMHCETRFWDNVKLERHLIIHSEAFQNSKIHHPDGHWFTCVFCLQKIPNYDDYMQHMRSHREDSEENVEFACKLCDKVYPKLMNLIRHSKLHVENATHKCIHCGKMMGIGDDFIDHMLRHEDFKPYICDMQSCGKKFVKIHKLRQHMETHIAPKSYVCNQCDKTFTEHEYLKRHLLRHSGRKDHACNICQARFTFKSGLRSHITTHTMEKSFLCNLCSSKFTKLSSLRTHEKIHNGEKKFVCDLCNMRFITSSHLRRHKVTHNKLKPYQCQYCSKSYTQSNDLVKHLRTHLGPNVYKCDINDCSEAFPKFTELKNHKMIHFAASEMLTEEAYGGDIESMKLI